MDNIICSVLNNVSFLSIMRQVLVIPENITDSRETTTQQDNNDKNNISKNKLTHVRKITDVVARDIITNFKNTYFDSAPPNKYCKMMRKVSMEVYTKYLMIFNNNVEIISNEVKKHDTEEYTVVDAFDGVILSMLEDRTNFHWGRISIIFTLAAVIAHNCRKKNQDSTEKLVKHVVKIFHQEKLDEWILENGGWESFADNFQNRNYEAKVKRTLYMAALGLGALASLPAKI